MENKSELSALQAYSRNAQRIIWRDGSIWSPKTSMTLQFSLDEKIEISWICLHMCECLCQFLLLCSHFKLVLKYRQCRTFQKSVSFAKTLQQAGRRDVCVQLSDGLKSPGEVRDSDNFFFFWLVCRIDGKRKSTQILRPFPRAHQTMRTPEAGLREGKEC